ncbi:endonuclease/exonuclease/phosphatase family protein [Salinithrix halophila]|uniref:Endonuclease/exonuclease/phosphatase family protein n=1 Tax=Salinithrix halophila TaxID=1485204 RepID=A0ABV8JCQ5_9BACL
MAYNIHHGVGCDGTLNLERIAGVIESEAPDLVGLNEVDVAFHRRSEFENQLQWLADRLGMKGVFGPSLRYRIFRRQSERQYGNGLLFRGNLQSMENQVFPGRGEEPRSILTARIEWQGCTYRGMVTHMGFTPWMRRKQTEAVRRLCREDPLPLIGMGDWNAGPGHPIVKSLAPELVDVLTETGEERGSFSCRNPRKRIDFIFCTRHFLIRDGYILPTPSCPSDHLPVVGELDLTQ